MAINTFLPLEIQWKIFLLLPDHDKLKFRLVCKDWRMKCNAWFLSAKINEVFGRIIQNTLQKFKRNYTHSATHEDLHNTASGCLKGKKKVVLKKMNSPNIKRRISFPRKAQLQASLLKDLNFQHGCGSLGV